MKVAIIALFACVAVSHAAFTANLVQRAQPAVSQALFKVRLATGRSDLQTPLMQQLEEHANNLLEQINSAVQTGQQMASNAVQQLQDTWAQMQALGANVMESGSGILSNLLGGLFGGLFGGKGLIGDAVNFVQNFDLQGTIQSLLAYAENLVAQLNLPHLLQSAVSALFGGRGFFSDAWNQISSIGSAAWESMQTMFNQVTAVAGSAFNQVQNMASAFVQEASVNISAITTEAATNFLNFLKPYQQDLGALYEQVAAQVGAIMGKKF